MNLEEKTGKIPKTIRLASDSDAVDGIMERALLEIRAGHILEQELIISLKHLENELQSEKIKAKDLIELNNLQAAIYLLKDLNLGSS